MKKRKVKDFSQNQKSNKIGNKKVILAVLAISVVVIFGLVIVFLTSGGLHNVIRGISGNNNGRGNSVDQTTRAHLIKQISNPSYVNAPALGSNKAKITMVEFGDYRCHFCARFHRYTSGSIIQNFVNTGQVRFLFKDFIVNDKPGDSTSMLAAVASYCAADQGKYWKYHDVVYNNSKGENVA